MGGNYTRAEILAGSVTVRRSGSARHDRAAEGESKGSEGCRKGRPRLHGGIEGSELLVLAGEGDLVPLCEDLFRGA
jgi:hypothetical protein